MNNLTELVIIIDRSGSMHGLEKDVIGGFNSLIKEQAKEGEVKVTTIFFNDKIKFIHEQVDIQEIILLEDKDYIPSGCTALLDAIGDGISFIKASHSKLKEEEIPAHTIFSIMTDGMENSSNEYTYSRIKDMIELQKKCGWDFIFQAANIDVAKEADRLGISKDDALAFEASANGIERNMKYCSASILRKRGRR